MENAEKKTLHNTYVIEYSSYKEAVVGRLSLPRVPTNGEQEERLYSMQHVMLDLYGCNPELLANEQFLRQVLDNYPRRIGMEKVSPVMLRAIQTSDPMDDGFSGFVIIATSHISLHAWPPYKMINIDIFSCEEFDVADTVAYAQQMFQTDDIEVHTVERALRSPRLSARQKLLR